MDLRLVITILCQIALIQGVFTRSIDQLLAEVEDDFKKEQENGLQGRSFTPDWYEYSLVNRSEKLVKLQYDMIITKDTWRDVINTTEELPQDRRSKRNAVLEKDKLWTRRISFTISEEFSVQDKFLLLQAMNHWEEYTCLKFVEAKPTDLDVIDFRFPDVGICESHVGRMGGRQPINLSKGCMYKEILVHEIGHVLGFYHEHMRADRDQYVKINYKHINDSVKFQFDPLVANDYNDYNKPYDYYSIMHYGKLFFSINTTAKLVTIEPRNATFLDIIGESPSLSYYDMKIANDLYKCSDGCPVDACEDGFVGGSHCECFCQYSGPFDVRLCGTKAACEEPKIDHAMYFVYDKNSIEVKQFANGQTFPHRTQFLVLHRNENCNIIETNYTCNDGNWEGNPPPCNMRKHVQRKACRVQYDPNIYVITYNGGVSDIGARVPDNEAMNVTCKHKTPGIDVQPVYCDDGKWEFSIEEHLLCKTRSFCQMVTNATLTGSFEDGFEISCIGGHSIVADGLVPDRFSCNTDGEWEPFSPMCEPTNCTVPKGNGKGVITDVNGALLNSGAVVLHGSDVILTCPVSYIPDINHYTCSYGTYSTASGKIPTCVQVKCGQPPVKDTSYIPNKDIYLYGDYVHMKRCQKGHELVGDRKLKCTKHGNWSSTAECKPYCHDGIDTFTRNQGKKLSKSAGWSSTSRVNSYTTCQRKCETRSYICRGFVFGHNGQHYTCTLYVRRPDKLMKSFIEAPFWTTTIRVCKTN